MMDYPLQDVLDLMRQHLDFARRNRQQEQSAFAGKPKETEKVVYRRADDSWF